MAATHSGIRRFDKVGILIAAIVGVALFMPFVSFAENRIVEGAGRSILEALPGLQGAVLLALVTAGTMVVLLPTRLSLRAASSAVVIIATGFFAGLSADFLLADAARFARISPASGFWLLLLAFLLALADALARLRPPPLLRIAFLLAAAGILGLLLVSGVWSNLSVLNEYANNAQAFWREARQHMLLAFGSLFAACLVGIPLGMACRASRRVRSMVLNSLTLIQTIPSIALFGLLIAPLSWAAAQSTWAKALGISGIGTTPALIALVAYALLPVVANTVAGLDAVAPAVRDAARGMGMTRWQQLGQVEFPLALPVILAGIRIVLVQNIGLATIAALIGGGGFGVFVFQGISQMAMDLVLLGTVPTILLAFASAVLMDAIIDISSHRNSRRVRPS